MLAKEFALKDDFPPANYDQWRALAEADLKGASFDQKLVSHTYEGIAIQPLYTRRDKLSEADAIGSPGQPPFVRGSSSLGAVVKGWDLRQEHAHPDLTTTSRAILDDLAGGVTSLLLRFDQAARDGLDPDDSTALKLAGRDGVMLYSVDDLDAVLSKVHLNMVGIAMNAGAAYMPTVAALVALWRRRNVSPEEARGAFNADPLAVLAAEGELPYSADTAMSQLGDLALWTSRNYANVTAVGVDTSVYHNAGATSAQDIAFGIATALEYLRAMTAAGMDIDSAARQIEFSISLGTHHFLAISKLRAARKLWSRVVEVSGGSASARAMHINARTSRRVLTQRDPYVNLLRNTVGVFAAGLGGAESITSVPFDAPLGEPDLFSRRVARNTLLVLQEESHLHRVIDPAGGSWFLDRLTEELADKAWEIFQQIEGEGGMLQSLIEGNIARRIDAAYSPRAEDIARRKEGITGVSEFPDVAEANIVRPPIELDQLVRKAIGRIAKLRRDSPMLTTFSEVRMPRMATAVAAAEQGASIGQLSRALGYRKESIEITPIASRSFAGPFEQLRSASDAWQAKHGKRPTVFLASMGSVSQHTARSMYAKNFFESGGFTVVANNGFADVDTAAKSFADSGAKVAVICSSDKQYPELVPQLAEKLKAAGARSVVLAGNPGGNEQVWRSAGVDRFIFVKCDVLATLSDLLREEGVLPATKS